MSSLLLIYHFVGHEFQFNINNKNRTRQPLRNLNLAYDFRLPQFFPTGFARNIFYNTEFLKAIKGLLHMLLTI